MEKNNRSLFFLVMLLGFYSSFHWRELLIPNSLAVILITSSIGISLFFFKIRYSSLLISALIGIFLFIISFLPYYNFSNFSKLNNQTVKIKGRVLDFANKNNQTKIKLAIDSLYYQKQALDLANYNIKVFFPRRIDSLELATLTLEGKFQQFKIKSANHYQKTYANYYYANKLIGKLANPRIISFKKKNSALKNLKNYLRKKILSGFNYSTANLSLSMVLGDKFMLEKGSLELFKENGIMHLLAISGMHFGIVFLLLLSFCKFLIFLKPWQQSILAVILLFCYLYLIDFQPSATRAFIMIALFNLSYLFKRIINPFDLIGATGILNLLIAPRTALSLGFILSYSIVYAIFYFYQDLLNFFKKYCNSKTEPIAKIPAVSLAASLGAVPLSLFYFNYYNFLSILIGIILTPLTISLIYLNFYYALLGNFPIIDQYLIHLTNLCGDFYYYLLESFRKINFLQLNYHLSFTGLLMIVGILFLLSKKARKQRKLILTCLCLLLLFRIINYRPEQNYCFYFENSKKKGVYLVDNQQNYLYLKNLKQEDIKLIIKPFLINSNIHKISILYADKNYFEKDLAIKIKQHLKISPQKDYLISLQKEITVPIEPKILCSNKKGLYF